ncbi:MAG: ribonuclease D [Candidatus Paracaedibacteraceae bacterium]|nr:ribonuclease D [Candidatus Paracaedibacteraceae bacterium]
MQIVYVDSAIALNAAVTNMAAESTYLAIDTEFRREDTYFPELCLIQVATSDTVFLIDALEVKDLTPFFDILKKTTMLKVFHSGRQDLEIFCHLMQGEITAPIFDTQIAAMLAGYGESAGFETLVSKLLSVSLDKTSRHTDWTQRPLTEEQKTYAINDVLYLRPLYELMVKKLTAKGRLDWMRSEVRLLETSDFLITVPSEAWRRLSLRNPSARYLAIVRKLAEWREETAQKTNIPRAWLLKDEVILDIASRKISLMDGLFKIPNFPSNDELIANDVFNIVQTVLNQPVDELPLLEVLPSLNKSQQNILEMLKLLLKITAEKLEVSPRLIAEKEDLIKWLTTAEIQEEKDTANWRDEAFWKKAKELLDGRLVLRVHNGRIKFEPVEDKSSCSPSSINQPVT